MLFNNEQQSSRISDSLRRSMRTITLGILYKIPKTGIKMSQSHPMQYIDKDEKFYNINGK